MAFLLDEGSAKIIDDVKFDSPSMPAEPHCTGALLIITQNGGTH